MKPATLFLLALALAGCARDAGTPADDQIDASASPAASVPDTEGFVPIRSDDLEFHVTEKTGGAVGVSGDADSFALKGNIRAYAYTKKPYKNFTLRLDYRWPNAANLPEAERPNANTGVLLFITGEHKVWPKCLEVQGKWSEMGQIKSNAKDVTVTALDDEASRVHARRPVGEWNSLQIEAREGALVVSLNGTHVARSEPTELREGPIGFQAERFDVEFRNVRIRED